MRWCVLCSFGKGQDGSCRYCRKPEGGESKGVNSVSAHRTVRPKFLSLTLCSCTTSTEMYSSGRKSAGDTLFLKQKALYQTLTELWGLLSLLPALFEDLK